MLHNVCVFATFLYFFDRQTARKRGRVVLSIKPRNFKVQYLNEAKYGSEL